MNEINERNVTRSTKGRKGRRTKLQSLAGVVVRAAPSGQPLITAVR